MVTNPEKMDDLRWVPPKITHIDTYALTAPFQSHLQTKRSESGRVRKVYKDQKYVSKTRNPKNLHFVAFLVIV